MYIAFFIIPGCIDTNNLCSSAFDGAGTCVNISNPDWNELHHNFDLSQPDVPGACLASTDDSCCRCIKKKKCLDKGCKDDFGGSGICIDVKGPMEKIDIDWEAGQNPKPDLCEHTLKKDCCSCFKLNDKKVCKNDMCKEKGGKCIMPHMNDMETKLLEEGWNWEYYCDEELDCKCYRPQDNDDIGCDNNNCTENGGKCIMSGEQAPQDWEAKSFCNEEIHCKCYTPKEEDCKNVDCTNTKKGTCIMPYENPPANHEVNGFCNQEMGCKCYVPKSDTEPEDCKSEKCEQIFGVCVKEGQSIASSIASLYQPATGNAAFCDKASECKCYKPKCKRTNKCKAAKGQCFSNKIVPSGWSLVKKKGKNIVCNKSLKCYCYKQGGKSERSLEDDNNDLDFEEEFGRWT